MDYPDPDEEFELMYAEEFEAMENFDGKYTSIYCRCHNPYCNCY